jgi:glycosyltransferase involved in cell wall biosynthesis
MRVSVIIPVYNTEKYIGRCIESILKQTLKDLEVIIVNDATLDDAMSIVRKYASSDKRIRIIEHSRNRGAYASRQTGYKAAGGDYLTFVDSDDYLPLNALETLYDSIEKEEVDIVCASMLKVTKDRLLQKRTPKLSHGTDRLSIYKSLLSVELTHSLCSKIYRRSTLFENQDYESFENLNHGTDGRLFYQIVSNMKSIKVIDDVVYYYYFNTQSSTNTRMTEDKCRQIVQSFCYRCNKVRDMDELSPFIIRHELQVLLKMFLRNYEKKTIYKYADLPDLRELSTWKTLSRYYSGIELFSNYTVFNSRIVRQMIGFIRKKFKKTFIKLEKGKRMWKYFREKN